MSITCSILSGRERQCKNTVGGAKTLFLGLHSDFLTGVVAGGTNDQIDELPTATLYRFEVDPSASSLSLVSTINASPDNGTVFYAQVITAKYKKITALDRANFANIAASQLAAFVLDNNGNIFYVGKVNGADVTGGENMNTGNALGDMSGFNITITANEPAPPYMLEAYTTEPFDNFAGITVSPAFPSAS
jgi:hypothetical protein